MLNIEYIEHADEDFGEIIGDEFDEFAGKKITLYFFIKYFG